MKSILALGVVAAVPTFSYRETGTDETCKATNDGQDSKLCGMSGDNNWNTAWPACEGKTQSPINLIHMKDADEKDLPDLMVYGPNSSECGKTTGTCTWKHEKNGHGVKWTPTDCLMCAKRTGFQYNLLQCHMHGPSEHAINGERSALEIHCVHQKDGSTGYNDLLVIGVLLNGADETDVPHIDSSLKASYNKINGVEETKDIEGFFPSNFAAKAHAYYHYDGSLTTPPCTAGQHWYVVDKIYNVKKEQVDGFRSIMKLAEVSDQKMMELASATKLLHLESVVPAFADDDLLSSRDLQDLGDRKIFHVGRQEVATTDSKEKDHKHDEKPKSNSDSFALAISAIGIVGLWL